MGAWCVCVPTPPAPPPALPSKESPGRSLYGCFVESGDSQTGPQRRVCPAEQSHLMGCVFVRTHQGVFVLLTICMCHFGLFPFPICKFRAVY